MKTCNECGSAMESRTGRFWFRPPGNVPGGMIIVDDAKWLECGNCGSQALPKALDSKLERIALLRQLPDEVIARRVILALTTGDGLSNRNLAKALSHFREIESLTRERAPTRQ